MPWLTFERRKFQEINSLLPACAWERRPAHSNRTQSIMTDHSSLAALKQKATNLGLTPYASLYGDRRQRATWENLLESAGELTPLIKRKIEPDRAQITQINWKLAIAFLVGAIALNFLLQPLWSKGFPLKIEVKINIQIGTKL
jgi:hypothetical protein